MARRWLARFFAWWWRDGDGGGDEDDDRGVLAQLPDSTRQFVSVLKLPNEADRRRVYLLAAQSLSERSAADASHLISVVQPKAVIAQVAPGLLLEQLGLKAHRVPTSIVGIIKDCFNDTSRRASYETKASIDVLQSIFGTTIQGHVVRAKEAAEAANAAFFYLESPPWIAAASSSSSSSSNEVGKDGLKLNDSCDMGERVHGLVLQRLKSINFFAASTRESSTSEECPEFAGSFYSYLVELHRVYSHFAGIDQALQQARKLLFDVAQGQPVQPEQLVEAQKFRVAVEGVRVAFNAAAREQFKPSKQQYEDLSSEEQRDVLLVQAIQHQARKHGDLVVVLDASSIAGIRKQWNNTKVPEEVLALARHSFLNSEVKEDSSSQDRAAVEKALVGSGAVAVGLAALPWWAPATPFTKVVIVKGPAFMKLALLQMKRNAGVFIAKTVPLASPGKLSALFKTAASAGKTRAAAHSLVATAERATFSAVRTAFYCLMRKKQGMSSGSRPWLLLGGSVAAGAGILWSGERLESAIESAPHAPRLARLGRGLEKLEKAAQETGSRQAWEELYRSLLK